MFEPKFHFDDGSDDDFVATPKQRFPVGVPADEGAKTQNLLKTVMNCGLGLTQRSQNGRHDEALSTGLCSAIASLAAPTLLLLVGPVYSATCPRRRRIASRRAFGSKRAASVVRTNVKLQLGDASTLDSLFPHGQVNPPHFVHCVGAYCVPASHIVLDAHWCRYACACQISFSMNSEPNGDDDDDGDDTSESAVCRASLAKQESSEVDSVFYGHAKAFKKVLGPTRVRSYGVALVLPHYLQHVSVQLPWRGGCRGCLIEVTQSILQASTPLVLCLLDVPEGQRVEDRGRVKNICVWGSAHLLGEVKFSLYACTMFALRNPQSQSK
eukprot:scaffold62431_cov22-Tisochrysis_lutea.AAC.1